MKKKKKKKQMSFENKNCSENGRLQGVEKVENGKKHNWKMKKS